MIDLPRGFVASNQPFPGSSRVAGLHLATHAATQVHVIGSKEKFLVLIGYAFDITGNLPDEAEILQKLFASCSIDEITTQTDHLNGRFALVGKIGGQSFAFNDAGALRTIFYHSGDPFFLSSHSNLIADITGEKPRTDLYQHFRGGLPGNQSRFPGIRLLPANLYVEPLQGTLTRYWPRAERVECPSSEIQPEFNNLLRASADAFSARHKPIIGLTAGLDSRVSAAVFRNYKGARFFTHSPNGLTNIEAKTARAVCEQAGWAHEIVPLIHDSHPLGNRMADYRHNKSVWPSYLEYFGSEPINVRSVLPEIGMRFWKDNGVNSINAKIASNLTRNKEKVGLATAKEAYDFALAEFERFLPVLGYEDRIHMGYERLDLYYWEHRLSTWHGPILLGLDATFDTFIVFNSRAVIERMLAVNQEDRAAKVLFYGALREFAPDLLNIAINPHKLKTAIQPQ